MIGAIAGGIAQARYGGVPDAILLEAHRRLPQAFLTVVDAVAKRFGW
jgi:ADP-ribosylglycohydrolase